jgi:ketosteroid isomerase-like protein
LCLVRPSSRTRAPAATAIPAVEEETTDGTVVVTGRYQGAARATGRAYEAEFAHLWRVTDGRISWLHQYTDIARWHEALAPAAG